MNKKVNQVYKTDNFKMFKVLGGNRSVSPARVKTLVNSIKTNGYIGSPIVVNENYEVIDGQGRLEACKELNVPIDYIIVEGLKIEECRVLNQYMQNWKCTDFIDSYAESGMLDYQRLRVFTKTGFSIKTYMFANSLYGGSSFHKSVIEAGNAVCSEETFNNAMKALAFLKELSPLTKRIKGRYRDFDCAVIFAYYCPNVDNDRLKFAIEKYSHIVPGVTGVTDAMEQLEKIYNRGLKEGRIYLLVEYDKYKRGIK